MPVRARLWILLVLLLGLGAAYALSVRVPEMAVPDDSLVLETEHLATLLPHEHGQEDSVTDEWHHVILNAPGTTTRRDMYVVGLHFEVANAPTSTVHHMSLTDVSKPNLTCPDYPTGKELFSFASDRMYDNDIRFPDGYALFIPKGTPLAMYAMFHNPLPPVGPGGTYHDVYSRVRFLETHQDPSTLKLLTPYLIHLDDKPCAYGGADGEDGLIFTIPGNTEGYEFSGEGRTDPAASVTFKKPVTLVNLTAHLHEHQYGRELIVHRNDDTLLTFRPTPTNDPYFTPTYSNPGIFHLNAGDTLWLTAVYDNPSPIPTRGAMAALGFYYTEE